jgi:hypothetical protein
MATEIGLQFCCWHFSDLTVRAGDVRSLEQSGLRRYWSSYAKESKVRLSRSTTYCENARADATA